MNRLLAYIRELAKTLEVVDGNFLFYDDSKTFKFSLLFFLCIGINLSDALLQIPTNVVNNKFSEVNMIRYITQKNTVVFFLFNI